MNFEVITWEFLMTGKGTNRVPTIYVQTAAAEATMPSQEVTFSQPALSNAPAVTAAVCLHYGPKAVNNLFQ